MKLERDVYFRSRSPPSTTTVTQPSTPSIKSLEARAPPRRLRGLRDTVRVGAPALSPHSLRAGAGDPARLGERDLALRSSLRTVRAAARRTQQRQVQEQVRAAETVYSRRSRGDRGVGFGDRTRGGYRVGVWG